MGRTLSSRRQVLRSEKPRRPLTLPVGSEPREPLDQDGVVFQGGRVLQKRVEQLVVTSRRHVEALLDGALLDPGVLPPRPLEVEDVYVELTEFHVANLARPA